jgi:hypothetical protein
LFGPFFQKKFLEILEDGNYICNALLLSSKRINNKINFIDLLTLSIIIAPQLSQKLDLIEELGWEH